MAPAWDSCSERAETGESLLTSLASSKHFRQKKKNSLMVCGAAYKGDTSAWGQNPSETSPPAEPAPSSSTFPQLKPSHSETQSNFESAEHKWSCQAWNPGLSWNQSLCLTYQNQEGKVPEKQAGWKKHRKGQGLKGKQGASLLTTDSCWVRDWKAMEGQIGKVVAAGSSPRD